MKNKIQIPIRLFPSVQDIEKSEARKAELENAGYTLTNETRTLLTYELI